MADSGSPVSEKAPCRGNRVNKASPRPRVGRLWQSTTSCRSLGVGADGMKQRGSSLLLLSRHDLVGKEHSQLLLL